MTSLLIRCVSASTWYRCQACTLALLDCWNNCRRASLIGCELMENTSLKVSSLYNSKNELSILCLFWTIPCLVIIFSLRIMWLLLNRTFFIHIIITIIIIIYTNLCAAEPMTNAASLLISSFVLFKAFSTRSIPPISTRSNALSICMNQNYMNNMTKVE